MPGRGAASQPITYHNICWVSQRASIKVSCKYGRVQAPPQECHEQDAEMFQSYRAPMTALDPKTLWGRATAEKSGGLGFEKRSLPILTGTDSGVGQCTGAVVLGHRTLPVDGSGALGVDP